MTRRQLQRIDELLRKKRRVSLVVAGEKVALPDSLVRVLRAAVSSLTHASLSTHDAAALLNVSRQYVVRLVENGALAADVTEGGHRRIQLEALLAYRSSRDAKRAAALDELETMTEKYGGYAKLKR